MVGRPTARATRQADFGVSSRAKIMRQLQVRIELLKYVGFSLATRPTYIKLVLQFRPKS